MTTFRTSDFEQALEAKGFERDKTHHFMFWFYVDGKKSQIRTRSSHSERQFDDFLADQRKKQMCLSVDQFRDFVECRLTGEMYRAHMLDNNHVTMQVSQPDTKAATPKRTKAPTPKVKK